ncbi:hypothetical protein GCM10011514_06290 [Emticicia aquatilis]|uniref:Uncharacterized protein n=1 Tax=Emticicia aquatilis TaxID=1537369 RepID=A0A916YHC2_9BACT|nr:hypothetical protein [Emticicia aquatilis]GGD45020.1 hypothetical protein GCM10011514_06290 [Emticicia aquatilis]
MNNKRKTLADLQAEQGQTPEPAEDGATSTEDNPTPETPTPAETEETSTETATEQGATNQSQANASSSQMVSISATELAALRADATEWNQKKGRYEVLNTWYDNMKAAGVTHDGDAADNKPSVKRQSKGNARAIAIAEKLA